MAGQDSGEPDLKAVYEEVCRQHDGIAEFRAKLLGFLPLASGTAGIFLLVSDKVSAAMPHLLAIGAFGVLATFGLFWYELRGIQKCHILIECGKALEMRFLGQENGPGAFTVGQKGVPFTSRVTVGVVGAALIIYPTVLGGWSYIACLGLIFLGMPLVGLAPPPAPAAAVPPTAPVPPGAVIVALVVAAAAMILCMLWGWKVQQQQQEEQKKEIQQKSQQWLQWAQKSFQKSVLK